MICFQLTPFAPLFEHHFHIILFQLASAHSKQKVIMWLKLAAVVAIVSSNNIIITASLSPVYCRRSEFWG